MNDDDLADRFRARIAALCADGWRWERMAPTRALLQRRKYDTPSGYEYAVGDRALDVDFARYDDAEKAARHYALIGNPFEKNGHEIGDAA